MALLPLGSAACGGDAGGDVEPTRSYSITLTVDDGGDEYRYLAAGAGDIDIRVGDEVTFELDNTGALPHDVQIVDPNGTTLAASEAVGPGGATSVTVLFDTPGFHRLNCLVGDHLTVHGMQTFVEVTDPAE